MDRQYQWGMGSLRNLRTLSPALQQALNKALELRDITIVTGFRGKEEQDKKYKEGFSKVEWPNSRHNALPAEAVDIQPYPYPPKDYEREALSYLAGLLTGIYYMQTGKKLRWGGDWDQDGDLADNKFDDLFHLEESEK